MSKPAPDIRKLARRQRWMIWLVLITIAAQFLPILYRGQYGMIVVVGSTTLQIVIHVIMIAGVVLLLTAQGTHILITIICGILMLAPCGNLLVLLLLNMSVTRTLRRAGLHVGLMGVKDDLVERIIDPGLCSGCGYNLTGNVSGYCPECGRPIDA
jgi:hypothetical protein